MLAKGLESNILDERDAVWAMDGGLDEARRREGAARVAAQGECVSAFWRDKYERDAGKAWHGFYKRNGDRAYKDRHYIDAAWDGVFDAPEGDVIEIGCGCPGERGRSKSTRVRFALAR